ncbi:MAG: recombinase RecT, partial [Prevotella sp.]|nr:recombinase RecT [Prevotella sp.]
KDMNTTTLTPQKRFNQTITSPATQKYLSDVLGSGSREFVSALTTLANNNAMLIKCEPMSLMYAAMNAPILGLALDKNLGYAYVIPYKDNKTGKTFAQFQMGYKGYLQLALRSGQFACINASDVREGELLGRNIKTGEISIQEVENREEKPIIGYVAYMKLTNGFEKDFYMSKAEVEKHAKRYSQSYRYDRNKSSIWATDFDAMAQKTVLKQLLSKYAPLSLEMQKAVKADQAVFDSKEGRFIDNDSEQVSNATSIAQQIAQANSPSDDETAMLREQYMQQVEQAEIVEQQQAEQGEEVPEVVEPQEMQPQPVKRTRKSATKPIEQTDESTSEQSDIIGGQSAEVATSNPELPFD